MTYKLQQVQPLPSDFSERIFTINLILTGPQEIAVRSCEVIGRTFRNRTSFTDASSVDEIFVERLAGAIRGVLAKVRDGAHVLALPEFLIELPGLALSGVHVMIMDVKNGVRSAIFRFKEFLGSTTQVFRSELALEEPYTNYSERLAVNVLADVCLPILNLAREMEFAHLQTGKPMPCTVEDRTREFEFQTELLKRFIHNTSLRDQHNLFSALEYVEPRQMKCIE